MICVEALTVCLCVCERKSVCVRARESRSISFIDWPTSVNRRELIWASTGAAVVMVFLRSIHCLCVCVWVCAHGLCSVYICTCLGIDIQVCWQCVGCTYTVHIDCVSYRACVLTPFPPPPSPFL